MKARFAFEAAVAEKVVVNGAVGGGEAQTRSESVLELFADKFGVGLFGLHDEIRENAENRDQGERSWRSTVRLRSGQAADSEKNKIVGQKKKRPERIGAYIYALLTYHKLNFCQGEFCSFLVLCFQRDRSVKRLPRFTAFVACARQSCAFLQRPRR